MKWSVFIAFANVFGAALYYLRRRKVRQRRSEGPEDSPPKHGFYPEIEKCHEINSRSITCSCQDFRKVREQFRHDDPRRLCKHLVKSFIDASSLPEDLVFFRKGIERCAEGHIGFPADRRRFDRYICGKRLSLMAPGEMTEEYRWVDVYYGDGLYSYSPKGGAWANDAAPPDEEEVIRFMCEKLGDPIPAQVSNRPDPPARAQTAGGKDRRKAAVSEPEALQDMEEVFKSILPPEAGLSLKETKSYIAVTLGGTRKWICRLYLNSGKRRHIGFPDGRKYALGDTGDIMKFRGQLLAAYRERTREKTKVDTLFSMREDSASAPDVVPAESRDNMRFFSHN